jgi:hypothetical protein
VIANVDAPPTLLLNETARRGAWLIVDAPGARRVDVVAQSQTWTGHAVVGGSFLSVSDPRFHFGLGAVNEVESITVTWPGKVEVRRNVAANAVVRVTRSR